MKKHYYKIEETPKVINENDYDISEDRLKENKTNMNMHYKFSFK